MKSGELKLLELLKADKESGVIRFKHRRMLIFDADAMGLLRKELVACSASDENGLNRVHWNS